MPELKQLQTAFQAYLLSEDTAVASMVVSTPKVNATERLTLYREGYYLRLLEALQQDYEVLSHYLGEEAFNQLAVDYIDAHPSSFRSIRWFGKELASLMKQMPLYAEQVGLIEMAEFEWQLTESFDAADCAILSMDQMAAIPPADWSDLHLYLHPSLRYCTLHWNTVSNWNAYKEQGECHSFEKSDSPITWISWRKANEVLFRSLVRAEKRMLDGFLAGQSIATICEGLCEWMTEDEVALQLATLLKQFIADELIVAIPTHCPQSNDVESNS